MAIAKKCDRCGSFYDRYEKQTKVMDSSTTYTINGASFVYFNTENIATSRVKFDLCPTCLDELIDFMNIEWEEVEFWDEFNNKPIYVKRPRQKHSL